MAKEVGSKHYLWFSGDCRFCGKHFEATRNDAKFCSAKCRVSASRKKKAGDDKWGEVKAMQNWVHELLKNSRNMTLTSEQVSDLRGLASLCVAVAQMAEDNLER